MGQEDLHWWVSVAVAKDGFGSRVGFKGTPEMALVTFHC